MKQCTNVLAALLLVTVAQLSACNVGDEIDDNSTDDSEDATGSIAYDPNASNPAVFDLHCLYAGDVYAKQAPNELAAAAIRAACDIQAARIPYIYPGMYPLQLSQPTAQQGIDCSGLSSHVWYVATQGFVRLPHSAAQQEKVLRDVDIADILPGDLIFYKSEKAASGRHVTIYLGDGLMIEASGHTRGVIVVPVRGSMSSIGRVW
jgi:hypothetical protein